MLLSFHEFNEQKVQPNKFKKQNETASSWDTGSYNDGDDGIQGGIFRRSSKVNTPLTFEVDEDLGTDPGMYSYFGFRGKNEEVKTDAVYSYFELQDESAQALYKWSQKAGIPNPVSPEKYHSTVVYSSIPFEGYVPYTEPFTIDPSTYSLTVLSEALVLKFTSKIGKSQWEKAKKLGAEFTFPTYTAHITLSYDPEIFDYENITPPDFVIGFKTEHLKIKGQEVDEEINAKFSLLDKAKDIAQSWIKSGDKRKSMTHLARLAQKVKLHPGPIKVFRGVNDNSVDHLERGASWTKSEKVAKDYAGKFGKVITKKLFKNTPALDINKLLKKDLKDQEVFVTHHGEENMTEHLLEIPKGLLEASKKMLMGEKEKDEKEEGKKSEKIVINPELNNPNTSPGGHSSPDMTAGTKL